MRSECKEAFLKEAARLEYCTYWDEKNDRPEAVLLQCHWSWFQVAWNHRQTEVDELQLKLSEDSRILHNIIDIERKKNVELQKRVEAVKQLIQTYKDEEKELELKEWEQSTIYGRIAIELEQALKGGGE